MSKRRDKYALQSISSSVLFHFGHEKHRTCTCGKYHHTVKPGQDRKVAVYKNGSSKSTFFGGLQTCGSVWTCPVCSAKITEHRRREISTALEKHRGTVIMVTQTIPHSSSDSLNESYSLLMKARQTFKDQRPLKKKSPLRFIIRTYKEICNDYNVIGDIASIEITYSFVNGWHPHCHSAIFFDKKLSKSEIAKIEHELRHAWKDALINRLKLNYKNHDALFYRGLKCDEIKNLDDYLAKFHESKRSEIEISKMIDSYKNRWSIPEELTKSHCKKSRSSKSLTPFDLLRVIGSKLSGKKEFSIFGKLFSEYSSCMFGKRQIFWSKGLKRLFGIKQYSDEELVDFDKDKEDKVIGHLTIPEWIFIRNNNLKDWFLCLTSKVEFYIAIQCLRRIQNHVRKTEEELKPLIRGKTSSVCGAV